MMWSPLLRLVSSVALGFLSASGPTHTWIADVKAKQATFIGKDVRIEGEVMDVRSTSPTVKRGFYRLADASDAAGVIVRTDNLPMEGGTFRLTAKIAADQPVPGSLLLDEVDRVRADGAPVAPLAAVVMSALGLLTVAALFGRALIEERKYLVAPPLWLLPDAGPYGKTLAMAGAPPVPLKYEPELEEEDRQHRELLKRRKRSLLRRLVGALALAGSSAAWALNSRPTGGQVPAFIFIDSNDPASRARRGQSDVADTIFADTLASTPIPPSRLDSARAAMLARRPDSVAPRPGGPVPSATVRPPAPASPQVPDPSRARDTAAPAPAPPPPAPVPPPPPPPAPAPAPEPAREPAPDPEAERSRAQEAMADGVGRLVSAINGKRSTDFTFLLPETMAGDIGRRDRFLKLIRDFGPRASLGSVEDAVLLAEGRGEARFSVAFTWRGDFGVDRKKVGHFIAVARRAAGGWQFDGARLLDAVP